MNDSSSTRQRRGSLALLPLFTLALFSAFSGSAQAQDIQWQHDVQAAMKKAKAEQKLVLLHFTADWCRPCQAMETFVFPNLEVVRAVEENVIAVRVDADQEKSLVTEYSVSAVPYDVIITPGGRIVRKQKSPLNANGYRRMMASLSREVKGVEDNTGAAITQQLAAADNQFDFRPQQISEFQSFTPNSPSHTAPVTSNDSAKLARRGRVENPYFASARKAAASSAATAANKNSFAQTGQANMEKVQSSLAPSARTIANDFASASTNKVNPSAATKASNDLVVEAPRVSSDFQVFNGADLKKQAIEIAKSRVELNSQTDNQTNGPSLTAGDFAPAAPMTQPANEVTAAPKTVSATQQPPRFAAKIQPNVVHQDRFYRDPIVPAAVDGTRSAKPTSVAQQLLKPIKQYPAAATEKMKQVTGKVNEAFSAIAKRGNPVKPNFNQGTTKSVKPRTPAQQLLKPTGSDPNEESASQARGFHPTTLGEPANNASSASTSTTRNTANNRPQQPLCCLGSNSRPR